MALIIGTTENPLHVNGNGCWCIYLVDGDGDNGLRMFGPDTVWACIEACPHIEAAIQGASDNLARGG